MQQAQQAAAEHAQRQGAGALTTGARLRANFLTVLETVLQHDSHLLDEAELGFAAAFQVLPTHSQSRDGADMGPCAPLKCIVRASGADGLGGPDRCAMSLPCIAASTQTGCAPCMRSSAVLTPCAHGLG